MTFRSAAVTTGTGSVSSTSGNNTPTVTVDLSGVANAQTITVTLFNVNDGSHTGHVGVPMGMLLGDVNFNRAVTSADVSLVKAQVAAGGVVTSSNFRDDVNANGAITSADVSLTKAQVAAGAQLPTLP